MCQSTRRWIIISALQQSPEREASRDSEDTRINVMRLQEKQEVKNCVSSREVSSGNIARPGHATGCAQAEDARQEVTRLQHEHQLEKEQAPGESAGSVASKPIEGHEQKCSRLRREVKDAQEEVARPQGSWNKCGSADRS